MIGKKVLALIPIMLAVSFLTFFLLNLLPGCVECQVLGPQGVTPAALEAVRADLRLDDPLPVRYIGWLGDALQGDLGRSYQTRQEVSTAIMERLPVTVEIAVVSLLMSLVVAIPLGVLTAYRAGGPFDKVVTGTTFGLLSIPNFMMALLLIYVFAVRYGWFPATGWTRLTADPVGNLRSVFMPAFALATANVAVFTRLLRTDMIATLQEDHVMLARSKGLPTWRILLRHALRPSSFSLLTVAGLTVGNLLGGAVIVEEIFALPGIGRLLLSSIFQRDLLIVQGVVLLITIAYVVVNFTVDILYSFLDPRIRQGGRH
ncbi:MAG TPA: ABC transporter permease [Acidimicrobiales bacterium]|nr:ABC transporter permease [Acidimicrobiales bacterium]